MHKAYIERHSWCKCKQTYRQKCLPFFITTNKHLLARKTHKNTQKILLVFIQIFFYFLLTFRIHKRRVKKSYAPLFSYLAVVVVVHLDMAKPQLQLAYHQCILARLERIVNVTSSALHSYTPRQDGNA